MLYVMHYESEGLEKFFLNHVCLSAICVVRCRFYLFCYNLQKMSRAARYDNSRLQETRFS